MGALCCKGNIAGAVVFFSYLFCRGFTGLHLMLPAQAVLLTVVVGLAEDRYTRKPGQKTNLLDHHWIKWCCLAECIIISLALLMALAILLIGC
jgi:hypothetical protein